MSEFERDWTHIEREQHARLLYQLKREIVAKRQAEQAQARQQRTAQPPQLELSQTPQPARPVESIPLPTRRMPQPSSEAAT